MSTSIKIVLITLLVSGSVFAQRPDREKIKVLKIAHITESDFTESEAKTLLLEMVRLEKEKAELHSKMLNDLLKILPAKKIVSLMQAERSFKHKMIEEFKERHSGEKGMHRRN